jgi:hypothetical protein
MANRRNGARWVHLRPSDASLREARSNPEGARSATSVRCRRDEPVATDFESRDTWCVLQSKREGGPTPSGGTYSVSTWDDETGNAEILEYDSVDQLICRREWELFRTGVPGPDGMCGERGHSILQASRSTHVRFATDPQATNPAPSAVTSRRSLPSS